MPTFEGGGRESHHEFQEAWATENNPVFNKNITKNFPNQYVFIETIGTLSGLCVFQLMTWIKYLICLFLKIGIITSKHNYVNKIS